MIPIPKKLREEMAAASEYQTCLRKKLLNDHECKPCPVMRKLIEWEHAIQFQGKRLQEKWAIVPICYETHRGKLLVKEINVWIALNRATDDELLRVSKATDYFFLRERLNKKYNKTLLV